MLIGTLIVFSLVTGAAIWLIMRYFFPKDVLEVRDCTPTDLRSVITTALKDIERKHKVRITKKEVVAEHIYGCIKTWTDMQNAILDEKMRDPNCWYDENNPPAMPTIKEKGRDKK